MEEAEEVILATIDEMRYLVPMWYQCGTNVDRREGKARTNIETCTVTWRR